MIDYEMIIPKTGTDTKFLIHVSDKYKDFSEDFTYLIKNVKYKEVIFNWDYKQGIFNIKCKK